MMNKKEHIQLTIICGILTFILLLLVGNLSNEYNKLKYLESLDNNMIQLNYDELPYNIKYEDKIKTDFNSSEYLYYFSISFIILAFLVFLRKTFDLYKIRGKYK